MRGIGASEFATLVNSRDGASVRNALQLFVATVKRQRRIALSGSIEEQDESDDESVGSQDSAKEDSESDGGDEDVPMKGSVVPPAAKRYKKDEAWKEDSASYNVPFVGTSVSTGKLDAVVPGEWPTGLLKVYLTKSPLAVELTGDVWAEESSWQTSLKQTHKDKNAQRKGQKLVTAVRIAHLRALSELITAAIPLEKLGYTSTQPISSTESKRITSNDDTGPRFLSEIVTKRLSGIVRLLAEETGQGKGKSGLSGEFGGCGPSVAPALTVLTRLCSVTTSIGTARHVARSLEQSLADGVLRFLVTSSPPRSVASNDAASGEKVRDSPRIQALVAGLDLAATLTELDDTVVFSCISSAGAKDRKIRPGLLFLALQRGLPGWCTSNPTDDRASLTLVKATSHLLRTVHDLLHRSSASKRALLDLFSRDCLSHLSSMTMAWAPPLADYEDVLERSDTYAAVEEKGDTVKRVAGIEARRVLFTLLSNLGTSPLLHAIQSARKHNRTNDAAVQLIVRALSNLLDDRSSVLEVRRFVLYTINQVPELLPELFRVVTLPDMTNRQFAFVTRLNCLSIFLRQGPSAHDCVSTDFSLNEINDDTIALVFVPLVFKKAIFTKALQHSNHLVALEAVKFLGVVVSRCQKFLNDQAPNENLSHSLKRVLPELPVLFVALSKLRFERERKSDILLFAYLCDAIRIYVSVFPTKFDWTKLLPSNATAFVTSPVLLQRMILSSIAAAEATQNHSKAAFHPAAAKIILEIAVSTRSHSILRGIRDILATYLRHSFLCGSACDPSDLPSICDEESKGDRSPYHDDAAMTRFVILCWVDGITRESIGEFCSLLQNAHSDSPHVAIDLAQAWLAAKLPSPVPSPRVSPVLVRALQRLSRVPSKFGFLTAQVCLRCLLRDPHPLPLAVLIVQSIPPHWLSSTDQSFRSLVEYASSMVHFERSTGLSRRTLSVEVLKAHFADDSYPLVWLLPSCGPGTRKALQNSEVASLIHQARHMASMFVDHDERRCHVILSRLLPMGLAVQPSLWKTALQFKGAEYAHCLVLSNRQHIRKVKSNHAVVEVERSLTAYDKNATDFSFDSQTGLLYFYLVGEFLSPYALSTVLCGMLNRWQSGDRELTDNPQTRLLCHFVQLACERKDGIDSLETAKLSYALLKVWLSSATDGKMSPLVARLTLSIENLLVLLTSSEIASVALIGFETELLVEKCISTKTLVAGEQDRGTESCLLSSIISTDPIRFIPVFFKAHHEQSTNPEYIHLLRRGHLDMAVCTALDSCCSVDQFPDFISSLASLVNHRAEEMLSSLDASFHHGLIALLHSVSQYPSALEVVAGSSILHVLSKLLESPLEAASGAEQAPAQSLALKVAVRCCQTCPGAELLSKGLLTYLGQWLSRMLRGRANMTNAIIPDKLLSWLQDILIQDKNFVSATAEEMCLWASNTIRTCLRYGMGKQAEDNLTTSYACLDFVKALIAALHDETSPMRHLRELFSPTIAFETFQMVTFHSQFYAMLKSSKKNALKLKIIQVLLSCLLGTSAIKFDEDVWNCMLEIHTAGVANFDTSLRYFLCLYGRCALLSPLLSLHRLRWGAAVLEAHDVPDWEWLMEAIELRRVYATVDNFPFEDRCLIEMGSPEVSGRNFTNFGLSTELQDDQRYSPGFLLPHILGALQAGAASFASLSGETLALDRDPGAGKGTFVAQRLCDKGALAIAFASLSSRSAVVRKLSLSVIGLFQAAIDSKYAHQLTSWRDRPQIAMIVRAVQRALVIRFNEDRGDSVLSSYETPMLPGFSAIFLAKASMLLSRPSDPMFLAVNRAFLRTESDGGGFQDLTRLPAFMALFCSSTDDPERLACERKFAIDLVDVGFLEEESYKLLMSCHCPELLMNAIQCATTVSSIKTDDEIPLLFRTLQKLVTVGGEKASSHLLVRLGLLHWLRSFLFESRTLLKPSVRLCFLKLLTLVASRTAGVIPPDEFDAATAGLVEPLLRLFFLDDDRRNVQDFPSQVIACELLPILTKSKTANILQGPSLNGFDPEAEPFDGVQLRTAVAFLSCLDTPIEIRSGLLAMCVLPMNCDPDTDVLKILCIKLLDLSMSHGGRDCTLICAALRRVTLLAKQLECSSAEREPILFRLLTWRNTCYYHDTTRNAWRWCFASLTTEIQSKTTILSEVKSRNDLLHWVAQNERQSQAMQYRA